MVLYYKNLRLETPTDVYGPAEDSFLMADNLQVNGGTVCDIGTGTGILALLAARMARKVTAIDINPSALEVARHNAKLNGISNIELRSSDLFKNVPEKFDLILFNPPYLPVREDDPLGKAWSGGHGGLEVIKTFLGEIKNHLNPQGRFQFIVSSLNKENFEKKYPVIARKKLPFEELYLLEGY